MTGQWHIWLAGSGTYIAPNDDSEITLTSLPTALQTVDTDNWVTLYPEGVEERPQPWERGAIAQRYNYIIRLRPFTYPDEMSDIDDIQTALRNRRLYLCMDGDGQAASTKYSRRLHTSGSCLSVRYASGEPEYNYERGYVEFTIELYRELPVL